MCEKQLVNIVAPVYKIPYGLLRESIQHMIDQTYKNIEIILIDDGSPDECGKICDEYAKIDARITVIHNENKGVSNARNTGIRLSQGKYICFVDADDFLEVTAVEKMIEIAEREQAELVVCNYDVSTNQKKVTSDKKFIFSGDDIITIKKSFISGGNIHGLAFTGAPWGKLYRTETIKDNLCYFDEQLPRSQDNEFNFRFADYIKKCVFIDASLYTYNVFGNSAMRKYWKDAERNSDVLLDRILDDIKELNNPEEYYEAFWKFTFTKIQDILYTDIMHKENRIKFSERVKRIHQLAGKMPYQESIVCTKKYQYRGYQKILLMFLKAKCYCMVALLVKARLIIKALS